MSAETAGASPQAEIGLIGGSGLYTFMEHGRQVEVSTPYGPPSDPVTIGEVAGRQVAFLPRHGHDHRFPAHRVPYLANIWALRSLGVRQILAPCAAGALRRTLAPGAFVVPDQLIDRTTCRRQTFYDAGAAHVSFADPYCPSGRRALLETAQQSQISAVDGGTLVVIEGPRFSTRAESQWFAAMGASLVNMTGHPEAVLARELALCYTCVALVTDLDAGLSTGEEVRQADVFQVFALHTERLRALLAEVIGALPTQRSCPCPHSLDGFALDVRLP